MNLIWSVDCESVPIAFVPPHDADSCNTRTRAMHQQSLNSSYVHTHLLPLCMHVHISVHFADLQRVGDIWQLLKQRVTPAPMLLLHSKYNHQWHHASPSQSPPHTIKRPTCSVGALFCSALEPSSSLSKPPIKFSNFMGDTFKKCVTNYHIGKQTWIQTHVTAWISKHIHKNIQMAHTPRQLKETSIYTHLQRRRYLGRRRQL